MYREKSRIEHSNPSPHLNTQIQVIIFAGGVTWIRNDDQSGLWSFSCFYFSQRKWTPLWVVKRKITSKNIFYDLQMDISSEPALYSASCSVLQKIQKMQCLKITCDKEMSQCGRESGQLDTVKAAWKPSRHFSSGLVSCAGPWWERREEKPVEVLYGVRGSRSSFGLLWEMYPRAV